jgi:ATP-dependent DNA helicase RecG
LRMARFRGLEKTEFNDQRQVHGHALQLMSAAMDFLSRHLPVAGRIEPGVSNAWMNRCFHLWRFERL